MIRSRFITIFGWSGRGDVVSSRTLLIFGMLSMLVCLLRDWGSNRRHRIWILLHQLAVHFGTVNWRPPTSFAIDNFQQWIPPFRRFLLHLDSKAVGYAWNDKLFHNTIKIDTGWNFQQIEIVHNFRISQWILFWCVRRTLAGRLIRFLLDIFRLFCFLNEFPSANGGRLKPNNILWQSRIN